jgi:hypothetical protein
MNKMNSFICRVLFVAAFVLAGLAILEKLLNLVRLTILQQRYEPGRLIEFAAVILLFVIALLLREVRHLLAPKAP